MQKLTPCLWFNFNADEAVEHYLSIFKNGKVLEVSHYGDAVPSLKGKVLTMRFELEGQEFLALNGGPQFPFTEAMSLQIDCEDQAEIDYFWDALTADGGAESQCGWCKDRWGMNWQVVPKGMDEFFNGSDPARTERAMRAMLTMRKIDVAAMQAAADGGV